MAIKPPQPTTPTPPKAATVPTTPAKAVQVQRPAYIEEQQIDVPMDESLQPTLKIIQSISPEALKGSEAYVPGAEAGMLMNSSTRELYDGAEGVIIIPLAVRKYWVEWKPRESGGGFVGSYDSKEDLEAAYTQGNEVQVTIEYMVMIEESKQMITVRFNSATKYPVARKWAQMIEQAKSLYGKKYRLKTVLKTNKNKQMYHNFDIEAVDWVSKETYTLCKELATSAQAKALPASGSDEL